MAQQGMSMSAKIGIGIVVAAVIAMVVIAIWYFGSTPSSELPSETGGTTSETSSITGATGGGDMTESGPGGNCPCKAGSFCNNSDRKCYEKCNAHGTCAADDVPRKDTYFCDYENKACKHCTVIPSNYCGTGTEVCCPSGDIGIGDGSGCSSGCYLYGNGSGTRCPGADMAWSNSRYQTAGKCQWLKSDGSAWVDWPSYTTQAACDQNDGPGGGIYRWYAPYNC